MSKAKPKISLVQTFALLVGIMIGAGILNLPASLAQEVHQDGWVGALLGGILAILIINLALSLLHTYPEKNFLQISRYLLGKYLGNLINLLFLIYFLLVGGVTLRISTSTISAWILAKTPLEILIIAFIGAAFYLTRAGLQTAARFSEIIIFIVSPFVLVIFFPISNWRMVNVLPFAQQPITNYVSATLVSIFAFLGFEILLLFYPYIEGSHKKIRFSTNLAMVFTTLIYTTLTFGVTAAFGSQRLQEETFVTLKYSELVHFAIIERVGFLLIFFWVFALFHTFALLYYFSYAIIEDFFSIKKNHWSFLLAIPLYFIALYPENAAAVNKFSSFVSNYGISVIAGSIVLLKGISFFKK